METRLSWSQQSLLAPRPVQPVRLPPLSLPLPSSSYPLPPPSPIPFPYSSFRSQHNGGHPGSCVHCAIAVAHLYDSHALSNGGVHVQVSDNDFVTFTYLSPVTLTLSFVTLVLLSLFLLCRRYRRMRQTYRVLLGGQPRFEASTVQNTEESGGQARLEFNNGGHYCCLYLPVSHSSSDCVCHVACSKETSNWLAEV